MYIKNCDSKRRRSIAFALTSTLVRADDRSFRQTSGYVSTILWRMKERIIKEDKSKEEKGREDDEE